MFFLRSHSFPNAQSGKLSFRIPQLPATKPSFVNKFSGAVNKLLLHQIIKRNDVTARLILSFAHPRSPLNSKNTSCLVSRFFHFFHNPLVFFDCHVVREETPVNHFKRLNIMVKNISCFFSCLFSTHFDVIIFSHVVVGNAINNRRKPTQQAIRLSCNKRSHLSFTSKFTSEIPLLATFPVLVLVVAVVHALAVVQLMHESLVLFKVFLLCFVLLASVVASCAA
nr:MAG TPA: hypothetical protein [Caudoviricetes sp.]